MNKSAVCSLASVLSCFFIMGFCDIVGISSDYVQHAFGWSPLKTSLVPSLVFIWFLFLGIPVGNVMNRWGRRNTVLAGMLVTLVGTLLPLVAYNSVTCLITYIFLGVGNAVLQVSLNPLLSNVVTDGRLLTGSLTAGQVIKALSSLLGPEIILLAVMWFGEERWYYCFPILGAFTLLSSLLLAATPIRRETTVGEKVSAGDSLRLLTDSRMAMLFFGIFFVVGLDVTVNFISSKVMMSRFAWSQEEASVAPQCYFLSRTVGAFVGAFLLTRIAEHKYMLANVVLCLLTLGVWIGASDATVNMICIGGVGFLASSVFSIIYSVAVRMMPAKTNQISGLMITAIAGGGVVSPFIGVVTASAGVTGGIWVAVGCTLYLLLCAVKMSRIVKNNC